MPIFVLRFGARGDLITLFQVYGSESPSCLILEHLAVYLDSELLKPNKTSPDMFRFDVQARGQTILVT